MTCDCSGFADDRPANPAGDFSKDAGNVKALSVGRGLGEGGREPANRPNRPNHAKCRELNSCLVGPWG